MKKMMQLVATAAAVALLSGCGSLGIKSSEYTDIKKNEIQATRDTGKAIYGSTRAMIANDPTIIDPYEAGHDAGTAQSLREIDAIRQKALENEKILKELVSGLLDVGIAAIPGGTVGASAAGLVQSKFKEFTTDKQQAASTKAELLAAITKVQESITKQEKDTDTKLAAIRTRIEQMEKDQAAIANAAKLEFAKLPLQDREDFKKEFITLLQQNGATKAELEAAQKKTPEDLLGGGGMLAAIYALYRTFGKSRVQTDVDQQYDKIAELEKELAALKASKS